jgi:hypothetical protein
MAIMVRLRGRAEPGFTVGDVVHHARLRGDDGLVADFQMARHARLAGEDGVVAQFGTARDAGLRDEQAMLADLHVVRDLHQIVYFCAASDDRRAERAAVHRHVRADFHVIADDDIANLRHLPMKTAVEHVAEAVRADDRAGVDADAPADLRAGINRDVRKINSSRRRCTESVADEIAGLQNHAFAPIFTRSPIDAMRADVGGRVNLRTRGDGGGRDGCPATNIGSGKKHRQRLGEREARIRHADDNFLRRGEHCRRR